MTGGRHASIANRAAGKCRAVSLAECLISVVLVGGLLATSLELIGRSAVATTKNADRTRGALLAEGLLAEIMALPYEDPDQPAVFGLESGESDGCRCDLDDVDDLSGYSESPPAYWDAKSIPGFDGWTRKVSVTFAATGDPMKDSMLDTGLKRIEISVWRGSIPVARAYGLRHKESAGSKGMLVDPL